MSRKVIAAGLVCSAFAYADFTYEQTSKITGGAMQSMMRVAGVFSKAAREPMKSTMLVKGDRMATMTGDRIDIIDLNAETFTEVDLKKKTYSVVTFAEARHAMEQAAQKMQSKQEKDVDMQFSVDVKPTGATRNISGFDTKETIVTLKAEFVNKKKPEEKGSFDSVMDLWLAPSISGYDEVKNFQMRLAQKLFWNPMGGLAGAMMAGQTKSLNEMAKEMSKLNGIPVYQVIRLGAMSVPQGAEGQQEPQAQQQQQQQQPPSVSEAIGRKLGGFGGLGRLGRKKTEEQQQPQQQQPAQQPQQQQTAQAGPRTASFMELTTELTGFSSAPVDTSKFEVPAGFKKVESERFKER